MDLNELIERERIRDVIYRYCEAVDAKDWVKVRLVSRKMQLSPMAVMMVQRISSSVLSKTF